MRRHLNWTARLGAVALLLPAITTAVVVAPGLAPPAVGTLPGATTNVTYTSGSNSYRVPSGVHTIVVDLVGGRGGSTTTAPGGSGAEVTGRLSVTPGETLQVVVGGSGSQPATGPQGTAVGGGGFNGGGNGSTSGNPVTIAAGGGGATEIRRDTTYLAVAGGGGGAGGQGGVVRVGSTDYPGGAGGAGGNAGSDGADGVKGSSDGANGGSGVTQGRGGKAGTNAGPGAGGAGGVDSRNDSDGTPGASGDNNRGGSGSTGQFNTAQGRGGGGGGGYRGAGGGGSSGTNTGANTPTAGGGGGGGGGGSLLPASQGALVVPTAKNPVAVISISAPGTRLLGTTTSTIDDPSYQLSSDRAISGYECSVDGSIFAACGAIWSPGPLTDGNHELRARAIGATGDEAGNADQTPASLTVRIDTTGPTTTITSGPEGPTADSTPSFTYVAADADTVSYRCSLDGSTLESCPATGVSYGPLADGPHTFAVQALDDFGNAREPTTRAFTVDTIAPVATITSGPEGPTADSTPSFTYVAADADTTSYRCSLDGGAFEPCPAAGVSYGPLADGAHTFAVQALDEVDNTRDPATRAFTVDTTAPVATISSGPTGRTLLRRPSFTYRADDSAAAFLCALDGAALSRCAASGRRFGPLSDGPHRFVVRATDSLGNLGPVAARTFAVTPVVTFGKITRRPRTGAAAVVVRTTSAGRVSITGPRVRATQARARTRFATLTVRAKGKAAQQLATTGTARVRVVVTFTSALGGTVRRALIVKLVKR